MSNQQRPEHQDAPELSTLFSNARKTFFKTSPYLKTRVLANLRVRNQHKKRVSLWRWVALSASSLALVGFISVAWLSRKATISENTFQAQTETPFAVRVEVAALSDQAIEFIEVELPEGVYFHSKKHPAIREQRTLVVHWSPERSQKRFFPFVISSEKTGVSVVKVKFMGADQKPISHKMVKIDFRGQA